MAKFTETFAHNCSIRLQNFLTHFEEWRFQLLDQVQEEILLRKAEAEAEYELQIRIHEQRIRRSHEVRFHHRDGNT